MSDINLPSLPYAVPLVEPTLVPTQTTQQWWQAFLLAIKAAFDEQADINAALQAVIDDQANQLILIQEAQADLADQLLLIQDAQATADQGVADAATADAKAVVADGKAVVADAKAVTADGKAVAAQGTANTAVSNAATAQSTANTANTNATTANTNATAAQTTANAVKKTDAASGSWTSPGAVLSATDAGSDATITIAAHTRYWGDGHSTSVAGGSLTGKAYNTDFYIYYDDSNQNDTSPGYVATTNANTAAYNKVTGRVSVGKVRTPASGGAATSGGTTPPGGSYTGPGDIP